MNETPAPTEIQAPPALPPVTEPAKKESDKYALQRDAEGTKLESKDIVLALENGKPIVGFLLTVRPEDGRATIACIRDRGWPTLSPEATFQHFKASTLLKVPVEAGVVELVKALEKQAAEKK
jgi:hypothetical protein